MTFDEVIMLTIFIIAFALSSEYIKNSLQQVFLLTVNFYILIYLHCHLGVELSITTVLNSIIKGILLSVVVKLINVRKNIN